jgi:hypothetical protein
MKNQKVRWCLIITSMTISVSLFAQKGEFKLENLSEFKNPSTNWVIAGDISSDYTKPYDIQVVSGKGILVNKQTEAAKGDIFTNFEHGDLDLELEFMMPKNSNSGLYFQSRYELQLLDSWGKKKLTSGDCGGIYERWDEKRPEGRKGYEGTAPKSNPLKLPGIWNKLKISFEAPKFENGKKIKNARFVKVILNGVTIQDNVVLNGVTRGAIDENEVALAPFRIQGDHGAVAFRNIKYTKFSSTDAVILKDIVCNYYEQNFDRRTNYQDFKPKISAKQDKIDASVAELKNGFLTQFSGKITLPETGNYTFDILMNGRAVLVIEKDTILKLNDAYFTRDFSDYPPTGNKDLQKGEYTFSILYWNPFPWISSAFGLFVTGPTVKMQALHAIQSLPPLSPPLPMILEVKESPKIMRHFLNFEGKMVTHPASVGDPSGIHYSINPENMAFLQFWRGDFLDMTPSWFERGGKDVTPLGNVIKIKNTPFINILENEKSAWKDTVNPNTFKFIGYYNDDNGKPRFKYEYENLKITDRIYPDDNDRILSREITTEGASDKKNVYCLLSESIDIQAQKDGSFLIGKEYFIKIKGETKPVIRESNGKKQLIIPINLSTGTSKINYSLIW